LCGGGNYYMTGSTGDDIWAFNDGVEKTAVVAGELEL
jgi:hypothetical protein